MKSKLRGLRNNNPANIRRGSSWKGLVPFLVDPSNNQRFYDKSFCQFASMEYGVRALIVLIRTYSYKYKLDTISKVLHRFAPVSENNTCAYISFVCRFISDLYDSTSFDWSDDLGTVHPTIFENDLMCWFHNPKSPTFVCRCLCKAICKMECGFNLTDEILDKAIALL